MPIMLKGQNFDVLDCLSAETTLCSLVLLQQRFPPPVEQTLCTETMMTRKKQSVRNMLETDRAHVVSLGLIRYGQRKRCEWLFLLESTLHVTTDANQHNIASVIYAPNYILQKRELRTIRLVAKNDGMEARSTIVDEKSRLARARTAKRRCVWHPVSPESSRCKREEAFGTNSAHTQ